MSIVRFDIGKAKASEPREGFTPNPKLKLLDQVSELMRFKLRGNRFLTSRWLGCGGNVRSR